ncbi:MAG: M18 family aminopeptidase [Clostridia bacterium]|nr:M18 family aminopeptidase [Clostridia bacterium]
MIQQQIASTKELIEFIGAAPTAFHAVQGIAARLQNAGFIALSEAQRPELVPGGSYYLTRNGSSVIAFRLPETAPRGLLIAASHSDSPTFKLKYNAEVVGAGGTLKLNTERYGGTILSSWLDRPLSIAGRAVVRTWNGITAKTVTLDRDLAIIPNVAIHQNRAINDGFKYNPACDIFPLIGEAESSGKLNELIAAEAGCEVKDLLGSDLYLYNRTPGTLFGLNDEFFASPRIDNLQCAFASLQAFLAVKPTEHIQMLAVFDNEETGSTSRQGAASTFLTDTVDMIGEALGMNAAAIHRWLPSSMMVSADNGHAVHPCHPELSDPQNAPRMNRGVVIKYNANQKYTTDALSAAMFRQICDSAGVPTQVFANRSDMMGGSTLGNISNTKLALNTVDIGLAQLAMHSCYETGGTSDTLYMIRALEAFYSISIEALSDGSYKIS